MTELKDFMDLSYIHEYTDGDRDSIKELVTIFNETFDADIDALETQITAGENQEWTQTAHKLKGAAGFVGAVKLAQFCLDAQMMASASIQQRQIVFENIRLSYLEVQKFLNEEMLT